jgi:preflagellin peptidase FlaK
VDLAPLDVLRLGLGASVLTFASYTDWRWRRAPNALWLLLGGAGLLLIAAQAATEPGLLARRAPLLLVDLLFAGLVFAFFRLGLLAGGADAKALMSLALLLPWPLALGSFPLRSDVLPPAFGVLGNALLCFLAVPLGLLAANARRGALRLPHALLGVHMPVREARGKHVWPMERVEEGKARTTLLPSRRRWTDEDWDALEAAGLHEAWVTPKVPFMLPLLAGFVLYGFVGDLFGAWLFGLPA